MRGTHQKQAIPLNAKPLKLRKTQSYSFPNSIHPIALPPPPARIKSRSGSKWSLFALSPSSRQKEQRSVFRLKRITLTLRSFPRCEICVCSANKDAQKFISRRSVFLRMRRFSSKWDLSYKVIRGFSRYFSTYSEKNISQQDFWRIIPVEELYRGRMPVYSKMDFLYVSQILDVKSRM